jgi:hypothetical protein
MFLCNVIVNMLAYISKKFRINLMNKKTHKTQFDFFLNNVILEFFKYKT